MTITRKCLCGWRAADGRTARRDALAAARTRAWLEDSMTDLLHGGTSTTLLHALPNLDANRRRFLLFGATAAGAAAAAPVLACPAALVEAPEAKPAAQGYQETEHVRNYYATTRI
jgi:hypothetical protein